MQTTSNICRLYILNGLLIQNTPDNRVKEGGDPEAGVVPEILLHKNLLPAHLEGPELQHSIGRVGLYHFDMSSTVTADTWTSAMQPSRQRLPLPRQQCL